jgi:hypothetical protein
MPYHDVYDTACVMVTVTVICLSLCGCMLINNNSVWGHRTYTLFGILSLAFIMLIIVTVMITIALVYFQLTVEDYRWWWRAFLSGAYVLLSLFTVSTRSSHITPYHSLFDLCCTNRSTGVFMYFYAAFYYTKRSEMDGALQATFFFGYMLAVCYFLSSYHISSPSFVCDHYHLQIIGIICICINVGCSELLDSREVRSSYILLHQG